MAAAAVAAADTVWAAPRTALAAASAASGTAAMACATPPSPQLAPRAPPSSASASPSPSSPSPSSPSSSPAAGSSPQLAAAPPPFVEIVMPDKQRAHVVVLRRWLLSPQHFLHPYPTREEEAALMAETGLRRKQLKNWFVNARKRLWKPLMAKCGARFTAGGMLPPTSLPMPIAPKKPRFTSRYRGVCAERSKWRAQITVGGKKQFLGTFATQREAALAYDAAARLHHGSRAVTNFGGSHSDVDNAGSDSDCAASAPGSPTAAATAAAPSAPPALSSVPGQFVSRLDVPAGSSLVVSPPPAVATPTKRRRHSDVESALPPKKRLRTRAYKSESAPADHDVAYSLLALCS